MSRQEIYQIVISELKEEIADAEESLLSAKVNKAIREVRTARKYPLNFTEEQIYNDLYKYIPNIESLALYDYNRIGAEGETSHSENGVNRNWIDRSYCFNGVLPISKITK